MTDLLRPCLAPLALALLLACPQAQPSPTPSPTHIGPGVEDPRVVVDTGDLYAARNPGLPEAPTAPPPDTKSAASLGTGRPDETNGVCRLYAPELREPTCCEHTLGFDVAAATATCNLPIFLGESFHNSCGFYFMREANTPAQWLRISTIRGDTPQQAADEHVLLSRRTNPTVAAEPFRGVAGAYWVRENEYRWAFLPGWKSVRALAWKTSSCSDDAIAGFIRQIIAAPETVEGPRRSGLLPDLWIPGREACARGPVKRAIQRASQPS